MPAFLISFLLNLALKFGIPLIVAWLKKRFGIGADSPVVQVLADFVEEAKTDKKGARVRARRRLHECKGVACPPETKG